MGVLMPWIEDTEPMTEGQWVPDTEEKPRDYRVDKDLALGIRQSASDFNKLLANATGVLDWGAKKIEELTGLKREGGFEVAKHYLDTMAENIKPTKEEWQDRNSLPSKIWQALAMTPGTLAEYGVGTAMTGGNPVAGMALVDSLREADKGANAAIMGAVKGAAMGGILHAVAPLQRVTRAVTMAGVAGGESAIQGADTTDTIVNMMTMGGLGLMGGKGMPLREAMSDKANLTAPMEITPKVPPIPQRAKPPVSYDLTKDLEVLRELESSGKVGQGVTDAVNRVVTELAPQAGVDISGIKYVDVKTYIDPTTPEGVDLARKHGISEEEITDAASRGEAFQVVGQHDIFDSESGQKRSEIKIFPDSTSEDVFHEFTHAVDSQGGLPGWAGTPEQRAKYLESQFKEGGKPNLPELTAEGRRLLQPGELETARVGSYDHLIQEATQDSELLSTQHQIKTKYIPKVEELAKENTPEGKMFAQALKIQALLDYKRAQGSPLRQYNDMKKWIEDNDEYLKSIDPDLLCQKSEGADTAINRLKTTLNEQYFADLGWEVFARASAAGLKTPCPQCYVFWARKGKEGSMQKKYIVGIGGYNGELLRIKEATLDAITERALRHYSSTDFKAEHIPGLIVQMMDATKKGIPVAGYTKEFDFVKMFGDTGAYINISIGRDLKVGADRSKANKARDKYANVSTVYVAFNDEEVLQALRDPTIDHVIPWHASTAKVDDMKAILRDPNTKDYKLQQNETIGGIKVEKNIPESAHGGDLETYLKLVDQAGITKKFPEIFDKLDDTEKNLYMKLIGPEYGKFQGGKGKVDAGEGRIYAPVDGTKINTRIANQVIARREAQATENLGKYIEIADQIAKEVKDGTFVRSDDTVIAKGNLPIENDFAAAVDYSLRRVPKPKTEQERQGQRVAVNGHMQAAVIPGLTEFIKQDLAPATKTFLEGAKEVIRDVVHFIAPRIGVKTPTLDMIMKMKGERDKSEFILERTTKDLEKTFDSMARVEQIAFIDSVKRGMAQATPELQQMADFIRQLDDALGAELARVKPTMSFMENHFRVLWKVIPGSLQEKLIGAFRRPLEGGKGYMKQHTLDDMSEGLALGGEPYSYNPITMFKAHYGDVMKYITAQNMWEGLKAVGDRQFVRFGSKTPEGYTRIDDKIAQVYFPVDQGMVKAGEWYVEDNAARILNRYLGRDLVRESALGKGLLWLKNSTTAVELSLSAFHFVFETIETAASGIGLGATKIWNQGVREANGRAILEGMKDIVTAPITPFTTARTGGSAIKFVSDPQAFLATGRGQDFIAKFPDATNLIADLFTGGGKLAMHQDYKINTLKAFKEALSANNYIGAAIRSIPALNEMLMKPMFEVYIPRLKIGMFLKEYSNALVENDSAIHAGTMTKPELARRTWDFVEDRLGEMNFDNLFWDRSFKSSLQILIRSVTWKLGNVRGFGKAFTEQGRELWDAAMTRRIPKLAPEMAWAWGVVATATTIGSIINYTATGELPQDTKDMVYPRIDKEGNRVSVPTYLRDAFHLMHKPVGWMTSSTSGWIGRFLEVVKNKDFYGSEIHDPDEDWATQSWDSLVHMVPLPFGVQSMKAMREKGEPIKTQAAGFLGFTKAPYYIEQTPAHQMANEMISEMMPQGAQSKEDVARRKIVKQYANMYMKAIHAKDDTKQVEVMKGISDDVFSGKIHMDDVDKFVRKLQLEPFDAAVKKISAKDSFKIWKVADNKEKMTMIPLMMDKFDHLADRSPEDYQLLAPKIEAWFKEAQNFYQNTGGIK
jgi:hypothetical protein